MLWICAQRTIKFIEEHFFALGNFVFLQSSIKHTFAFIAYFQAKK